MAYQRSNIGASLNKKRKVSFFKKMMAYFIFVLFFVSLAVWGLSTEQVCIKNIMVTGNTSVPTDNIMKVVNGELNKNYLWIIATDNILLLRRAEIKKQILDDNKKIGEVSIFIRGVEISIKERESKNLWCNGKSFDLKNCYFMDTNGFVFEKAPIFSEDAFPEYFGLLKEGDPVGQFYLKDNFKEVSSLYNAFKQIAFIPKYFNAVDEHEYEVYILGGGKILINDKKSFESSLINLQALIDNGYIKNDTASLNNIKYVDLRFGNKVNFELIK